MTKRLLALIMALSCVFSLLFCVPASAVHYQNGFSSGESRKAAASLAVKLSATTYEYTGSAITPKVKVTYGGKTLKNGTDYTVKYSSGRKLPGTYKVAVAFKGNYSGSKTLSFSVSIGKVTGFKQVKQSGYKLSLQWNKVTGATGYEVFMYNTKSKKWVHVGTTRSTKMNFKSTTGTNQWRIRAKAVISNKTYYGPFSGTLTTKS